MVPVPAQIHYELLLQILEQQTAIALYEQRDKFPDHQRQLQELVATLRKALAQQKQLEAACDRRNLPVDYRWSNEVTKPK
ncbi:MAG: DUF5340 domain-containing protein [Cyanobacteria bacterium P01_C01_bin.89]